jgi:hypothetical protein
LIEITTNKCFISYNNPLNYSLKYGITGECGNFRSFFAENPHLIKSNDRERWFIVSRKYFCAMGNSEKFKRSSVASQTGLPGKGGGLVSPVYRELVMKR